MSFLENDIIIAVMGDTGVGKSTFISLLTGDQIEIGHSLKSCTMAIGVYHFEYKGTRIFLVDTPGFDGTSKSESQMLRDVAFWLAATYTEKTQLAGVIYLQRISDLRMKSKGIPNIGAFRRLCGTNGLSSVILATTHWTSIYREHDAEREKELIKFWGPMIERGSAVVPHDGSKKSALRIVSRLVNRRIGITLDIQKELMDQKRSQSDTDTGPALRSDIKRISREKEEQYRPPQEERRSERAEYETLLASGVVHLNIYDAHAQIYRQYLNSSKSEIRLARITSIARDPKSPSKDDLTIECFLTVHSLSNPPPFMAISYVWGDPNNTVPILLNGNHFPVTTNLHHALCAFHAFWSDFIWVDALCIDQQDAKEKSHQIPLMHRIYKEAYEVSVYLGPTLNPATANFIQQWSAAVRSWQAENPSESLSSGAVSEIWMRVKDPFSVEKWKYVSKFFGLEYWNRLWTVQEATLNKRTILVHGSDRFHIAHLKTALQVWEFCEATSTLTLDSAVKAMISASAYHKATHMAALEQHRTILDVYLQTFYRSCFDPRDKVYGILALCEETTPATSLALKPDYQKPVNRVYIEFAEAILRQHEDAGLCLLSVAGIGTRPEDYSRLRMPSWVPCFCGPQTVSIASRFSGSGSSASWPAGSVQSPSIDVDSTLLSLSAVQFGVVKGIARSHATPMQALMSSYHLTRDNGRLELPRIHVPWLQGLFRALVFDNSTKWFGDRDFKDKNTRAWFCSLAVGFIKTLNSESPNTTKTWLLNEFCGPGQAPNDRELRQALNFYLQEQSNQMDHLMALFQSDYEAKISERSFFLTEDGLCGMGPLQIDELDVLCIVPGCSSPLVIRPHGTRFQLVGECYVVGFMDGEMVEGVRSGSLKVDRIHLV